MYNLYLGALMKRRQRIQIRSLKRWADKKNHTHTYTLHGPLKDPHERLTLSKRVSQVLWYIDFWFHPEPSAWTSPFLNMQLSQMAAPFSLFPSISLLCYYVFNLCYFLLISLLHNLLITLMQSLISIAKWFRKFKVPISSNARIYAQPLHK